MCSLVKDKTPQSFGTIGFDKINGQMWQGNGQGIKPEIADRDQSPWYYSYKKRMYIQEAASELLFLFLWAVFVILQVEIGYDVAQQQT